MTHQQGLQESVLADAGGEILERRLVECGARIRECGWLVNLAKRNLTKFRWSGLDG
jgi:hypothetical protein